MRVFFYGKKVVLFYYVYILFGCIFIIYYHYHYHFIYLEFRKVK